MPATDIAIHSNQKVSITAPWGFPLREDVAFTDLHGCDAGALGRGNRRELERLRDPLSAIIEPDEAVLYFARGQIMPGRPQRYMLGIPYRILTRAGLILTNRRILHIALKRDGQWNHRLRSARWGDISQFEVTGRYRGKLCLKYLNGSTETYWHIPKPAAEKLGVLLKALARASRGEPSAALGMASSCPRCFAALTPGVYQCANCGLKFKDENGALLHALTIPGGGYFYAELHLLGIAHAFVDVSVLASAVAATLIALGKVRPPLLAGVPQGRGMFALSAALFATTFVSDIWLAIRVARIEARNFIPIS